MWNPSTIFRSMITNDARCTYAIEWRIAMAKAEFNKKKNFHQQIGFKLVKKKSTIFGTSPCMVLKLGHIVKRIRNT